MQRSRQTGAHRSPKTIGRLWRLQYHRGCVPAGTTPTMEPNPHTPRPDAFLTRIPTRRRRDAEEVGEDVGEDGPRPCATPPMSVPAPTPAPASIFPTPPAGGGRVPGRSAGGGGASARAGVGVAGDFAAGGRGVSRGVEGVREGLQPSAPALVCGVLMGIRAIFPRFSRLRRVCLHTRHTQNARRGPTFDRFSRLRRVR